ncbi:cysteine desulfurase family protein [Chengkuizengella axinellae]|uniref:cysteine desulfurase n=1 Tax=Chengkuizengella axinellae TaxID=3064388 RepID=A0ABT9ITW6_9BACL|nr:cysteine desulfurase family protein [Chengkuizengella sp. 2205SS18-9]MDP5272801.1 cysteine desulfurase family protein [Chengkuizengella sp. 2205SS18-9]
MHNIYLDHAAATPLHPDVFEAMVPHLKEQYGNPSSLHSYGRAAKIALDSARDLVAAQLYCSPNEIIFTSGGTESDNLAIMGIVAASKRQPAHVITTQIEHRAVLSTCQHLEELGHSVTYLPVDKSGLVSIDDVRKAIKPETVLISINYGNNEVGTLQPIEEIGLLLREKGIYFHVDAVQALGKININLLELPVDLMSLSGHKINGPKGIGLLYVNKNVHLKPNIFGGNQERKRRGGTENLASAIGFSKALEMAVFNVNKNQKILNDLRSQMIEGLKKELGDHGFVINGHPNQRLPHILNVSFKQMNKETLLMNFDIEGIAAASGSACTSGSIKDSHVLDAMHLSPELKKGAIRFSFGLNNTKKEIEIAAKKVGTIVNRLRNK